MAIEPPLGRHRGRRTIDVLKAIQSKISSRALGPGERLPSIRAFARSMSVSPSTVVEAYDRLAAEGLIRARPGSGFYVSPTALPPFALAEDLPQMERAVDPFWVSRQSLDADGTAPKPGCGWLPPDFMPQDALRRAVRALARADGALLSDYGSTRGSLALRRILMGRFAEEGLELSSDQLLLAASGTQAVDLICRYLLRPGDTVLVDDPCYFNFRALLRAHQVKIVSVAYTPTGPDLASFAAIAAAERPRLYLTNSGLQNPTGATLSAQSAHRLLNEAATNDMMIVEDDIFADFEPEPSVRLAALDGLNRVIRIGSFSKTISASMRCGFIAARSDWIEDLVDLQVATNFGGPSPVATELIASVLSGGHYRKHMLGLHRRLARLRHETEEKLRHIGIKPWMMPRGGFNLWCRLPSDCDSADVARVSLAENVVLAPGNVFSVSQTAAGFMRFNVAQFGDPTVMNVLQRAIETTISKHE